MKKGKWELKPLAKGTPERARFGIFRAGRHVGICTYQDGHPTFKQSGTGGMLDSEFQECCLALWKTAGASAMAAVRMAAREKEKPAPVKPPLVLVPPPAPEPAAQPMTVHEGVTLAERPLTAREISALKFVFQQGADGCHVRAFEVVGFGDKLLAWLVAKGFLEMVETNPPIPRLKLTNRGRNVAVSHFPLRDA